VKVRGTKHGVVSVCFIVDKVDKVVLAVEMLVQPLFGTYLQVIICMFSALSP